MRGDPSLEIESRFQLIDALGDALAREENSGKLALVIVKLQRLRDVNIELGYAQGDALVKFVASRIDSCLRDKDRFVRIGAAEFAIVLPGLKNQAQPVMAATKIQRAFAEPLVIDGTALKVRLAFGISMSPTDADRADQLLRCADLALRHTREVGQEVTVYADCPKTTEQPMIDMEQALEQAIQNSELDSLYQPIIDVEAGQIIGLEMLSRWHDEQYGDVSPLAFVPLAERSNLVLPLTLWQLNTALRESQEWQWLLPSMSVSVNLSALVLRDSSLPELVLRALKVWDAREGQLTLEVTESAMMEDPEDCLEMLNRLHDLGVKLAIDDFGSGYSCLAHLKRLPVSMLKIDRSFVTHMIESLSDRRIVQSVIDLAQNFELQVIAEGVEDEETLDTLTLMGCECAQGRYIGPPMPSNKLGDWLQDSVWEAPILSAGGVARASYLSGSAGLG